MKPAPSPTASPRSASAPLALLGGPKAVPAENPDLFRWPIITEEDEQAVLAVLRAGNMSGTDVTRQFEREFADWMGLPHALAHPNGTTALQAAMWACGVRRGDEVVCPSMTYWASGLPALTLGATIVWADIDPRSLCLDPASLAARLGPRTRAVVVVHYAGHPADLDPILALCRPRGIRVIEDVSHAHGGLYKGRKLGSIGDCGAFSCMSGKSLAIGEGGMLVTADRRIHELAIAWGHYERHGRQCDELTLPEAMRFAGLPLGGVKNRLNQLSSALGRVQLRHYDARNEEILRAMNYFWDALEGTPGVRAHRPPPEVGRMGGWYFPRALYVAEELGGLPLARFCEALRAEGFPANPGASAPLHLHPLVNEADIYGDGCPTVVANARAGGPDARDPRAPRGSLPVSESVEQFVFSVPWFKHFRPAEIDPYVEAVRKVSARAAELR